MISTVFYSWQSDLPNATNRGFIQKALEDAAKAIRDDDSIQLEPVIDRDTEGVPGAPDIASTIFGKIEEAQLFVCDVSIIGQTGLRRTPNPNVLLELGYAVRALGWHRIIMVLNSAYGGPELLPFDLRMRRVVTYQMPEDASDRANERRRLQAILTGGVRAVLDGLADQMPGEIIQPKRQGTVLDLEPELKQADNLLFKISGEEAMRIGHGMVSADAILENAKAFDLSDEATFESLQILESRHYVKIGRVHNTTKLFHHVTITQYGFEEYARLYVDGYDSIVKAVGQQIILGHVDSTKISAILNHSIMLINHTIYSFETRGCFKLISSKTGDYNLHVYSITPALKRALE